MPEHEIERLCEGVVALVLKPSVLGGFERTAELAAWAAQRGMRAVISSSFETSLGISQLAQLAAAVDATAAAGGAAGATQHGLATAGWFAEDLLPASAAGQLVQMQPGSPSSSGMAIALEAAEAAGSSGVALALALDQQGAAAAQQPLRRHATVRTASGSYDFCLLEALPSAAAAGAAEQPPVLLLHGFLGAAYDWQPLLCALGTQRRCVALDLPGHGATAVTPGDGSASISSGPQEEFSLEAAAAAVAALVEQQGLAGCQLVGYSLGARLALLLAARWPHLFSGVASISGGWVWAGRRGRCAELHEVQTRRMLD